LCQLPDAQHLSRDAGEQLLRAGFSHEFCPGVLEVCRLPEAA
jgi:hypothetical protein